LIGKIIAIGIVAAIAFGIYWALTHWVSTDIKPTTIKMNVTKTWVDPENKVTYYLVSGKDIITHNDRVIQLRETHFLNTNIDIEFSKIQTGKVYTFSCVGYENLSTYDYYQCVVA